MKFKVWDKVRYRLESVLLKKGNVYPIIEVCIEVWSSTLYYWLENEDKAVVWVRQDSVELVQEDKLPHEDLSQTKERLKPISQTYSIDWFTFIIWDNGISIPWKWDERLWFKNSKKSVVKRFRQALDKFCDEMDI
jgi:hypothetical protein